MSDQQPSCVTADPHGALPVHAIRPAGLAGFVAARDDGAYLTQSGFTAAAGEIRLLPGADGVAGAVLGLGERTDPHVFGALPFGLPDRTWRLEPGDYDPAKAVLGFCLGAYQFTAFKAPRRAPARLVLPEADGVERSLQAAQATWRVRDLINMPADRLGPAELADAVAALGDRFGADTRLVTGDALRAEYPAIHAVGAGSDRAPVVAVLRWTGSGAAQDARLVSLCGKGVCFDTGGYDLKPPAGMLRMKKDMGGAAIMMGLAQMVMAADLPVRLVLRVGCVENSVSGRAMRPSDVIETRRGLTVEVGNTDAEGRLVLCDLLAEASDEAPAVLMDAATLTGAARVALGPELVAMFTNDDRLAGLLGQAAATCDDPLWRLPLWPGYDPWLGSTVADLNNVAGQPLAGAIVAALFLQRFVRRPIPWAHFDTYAWNDKTAPGRPEGGEAQAMRAAFTTVLNIIYSTEIEWNMEVT